jgi:hypothetical protein
MDVRRRPLTSSARISKLHIYRRVVRPPTSIGSHFFVRVHLGYRAIPQRRYPVAQLAEVRAIRRWNADVDTTNATPGLGFELTGQERR